MRKLSIFLFVLAIGFAGFGCDSDSSDDGPSVAERLAGNWALSGVSDDDGDQMETFSAGFNSVVISFTQSGNYTIAIDSKLPDGDDTLTGTFTVNESGKTLKLAVEVSGATSDLTFTYVFVGDAQVSFTADQGTSILLNVLLDTTLSGTVRLTLTKIQ